MKKQTLLGAVALTTLAVAGHAGAGTLTASSVASATVTAPVVIANDINITDADKLGSVGLVFTPSTGAILPTGNAIVTVKIIGGATFGTAVTAAAVQDNGTCEPTTVVSTGGAADTKEVTFLVSELGGCTNAVPLHLQLPIKLDGTNTGVDFEVGLKTEAGTAIDGVPASTNVAGTALISFENALNITTTADTVDTKALLATGFKTLSADVTLGTVTVDLDDTLLKGIATADTVEDTDIDEAVFTLIGDLSTVDARVGTIPFVTVAGKSQATVTSGIVGTHTITLATKTGAPVIKASTYAVETDLFNTDVLVTEFKATALEAGPSALQALTREGANYLLPWVASGTLASSSTSNTVVRLSNIGAEATGPVSVELLTSSKGVPASTALVEVAASIASGGEVVLTSGDLQSKLGADFGRGDIRVTVEGQPQSLIVRRFVQSTTTGALSEVSLGRDANGNEPRN